MNTSKADFGGGGGLSRTGPVLYANTTVCRFINDTDTNSKCIIKFGNVGFI